MTDIEVLLRHTIKTLQDTETIDWNSDSAKSLKKIYEDYYIEKSINEIICPCCGKKTYLKFSEKITKKVFYNYCGECIMLFK